MKFVDIAFVNTNLKQVEYAQPMVKLENQYPIRDGKKTYCYCFKRQQPSKISIPENLLDKLKFAVDDSNALYLVIDGIILERVTENGFKRIQLTSAYRPEEAKDGGSVE